MFWLANGWFVEFRVAAKVLQTRSDISYVKPASDDVEKDGVGTQKGRNGRLRK